MKFSPHFAIEEHLFKEKLEETLREFYVKYDLSWVDDLVNDLYDNSVSDNDIKEKYSVVISFESDENDVIVVVCAYDQSDKRYHIALNERLIMSDIEDQLKSNLTIELKRAIAHEDTHRQQDQIGMDASRIASPSDGTRKYLSQPQEIDARARELAYFFENEKCNAKEALRRIEQMDSLGSYTEVVQWYHLIGGSIYKKFLSEVYRYFYE
jgi:hypothetical protein